jgi:hypothetical protein
LRVKVLSVTVVIVVLKARPRFDEWSLEFRIANLDPGLLKRDMIHRILVDTGRFYGLGDFQPEFGLFKVEKFEVKELQGLTFNEWPQLLTLVLLYPSMVLASMLAVYLLYRALGWIEVGLNRSQKFLV